MFVTIYPFFGTTLYFTQSANLQTLQYQILKLLQTIAAAEQLANTAQLSNPAISELLSKAQGQGLVTSQTIELASMVLRRFR